MPMKKDPKDTNIIVDGLKKTDVLQLLIENVQFSNPSIIFDGMKRRFKLNVKEMGFSRFFVKTISHLERCKSQKSRDSQTTLIY